MAKRKRVSASASTAGPGSGSNNNAPTGSNNGSDAPYVTSNTFIFVSQPGFSTPEPTNSERPLKKTKHGNQHLPCPDSDDLKPLIEYYWKLGFNDHQIADQCLDHFDRNSFGLSYKSVQRLRGKLSLCGTRQQDATAEMIFPFYTEIRERFPTMGARAMVAHLRQNYNLKVSENFLNKFLKSHEPEAVLERLALHFKRKRFWSAGIMDILCFDQHDKWKRFGLYLHLGMEPYAGRIAWLKIWWTNRNPKLVTSCYIGASRRAGGIPLITQSDLGVENYGIANCHTLTRQRLDPSLAGTMQHRWMNKKTMNIKPEATWSQMRRQFTPGFENILDLGVSQGLYDANNALERLLFRWLAIPWLQAELDSWVIRFNSTPRRHDKNKILPHGIPDLITSKPHLYGTKDYKVLVPPELFDEMEQQWAPPDDPVFELTPPVFTAKILELYDSIGSPAVSSNNFWNVYTTLLNSIVLVEHELTADIQDTENENAFSSPVELIPNQKALRHGDNAVAGYGYVYYGGLADPPPLEGADPPLERTSSTNGQEEEEEEEEDLRLYADLAEDLEDLVED